LQAPGKRAESELTLGPFRMAVNRQSPLAKIHAPPLWAEESRVDEVYRRLLLEIVRGELPGGVELKSTHVADRLGVSRTPVVQALHRLAADGIVTLEMNKRAVVRTGAENWLVEIHQLRELLEPRAAALAAGRIAPATVARLERECDAIRPDASMPDEGSDWIASAQRFDFALHRTIADESGNLALAATIHKCWSYKWLSYVAADEPAEVAEAGLAEHRAVLAALSDGDSQTAEVAMRFHLRMAARRRPMRTIV